MTTWNLWHGCTKISPGCANCYVYRRDSQFGKDASRVEKTASFDLPVRRGKYGQYKLQPDGGTVYTCFTSDFFHEAADRWRVEAWEMMRIRSDLKFMFVTKRPERFFVSLPDDWGQGYENVYICCTCENQEMADKRLPVFIELPIRHKQITHEPMLGSIDISRYLSRYARDIEMVICGGESGDNARICRYEWILNTRRQCVEYGVPFHFKQTGARFEKDGRVYAVPRKFQQSQAAKANIDYFP
ncbi:MAG: DUF5131 family protein [Oscillospiraceae bacterium]|nr:DUF5131 family protein [Oscillospiraceae bacterium]